MFFQFSGELHPPGIVEFLVGQQSDDEVHGSKGRPYLMVVNCDYKKARTIHVNAPFAAELFDPASGKWSSAGTEFNLELPRGGGVIVRMAALRQQLQERSTRWGGLGPCRDGRERPARASVRVHGHGKVMEDCHGKAIS